MYTLPTSVWDELKEGPLQSYILDNRVDWTIFALDFESASQCCVRRAWSFPGKRDEWIYWRWCTNQLIDQLRDLEKRWIASRTQIPIKASPRETKRKKSIAWNKTHTNVCRRYELSQFTNFVSNHRRSIAAGFRAQCDFYRFVVFKTDFSLTVASPSTRDHLVIRTTQQSEAARPKIITKIKWDTKCSRVVVTSWSVVCQIYERTQLRDSVEI